MTSLFSSFSQNSQSIYPTKDCPNRYRPLFGTSSDLRGRQTGGACFQIVAPRTTKWATSYSNVIRIGLRNWRYVDPHKPSSLALLSLTTRLPHMFQLFLSYIVARLATAQLLVVIHYFPNYDVMAHSGRLFFFFFFRRFYLMSHSPSASRVISATWLQRQPSCPFQFTLMHS